MRITALIVSELNGKYPCTLFQVVQDASIQLCFNLICGIFSFPRSHVQLLNRPHCCI